MYKKQNVMYYISILLFMTRKYCKRNKSAGYGLYHCEKYRISQQLYEGSSREVYRTNQRNLSTKTEAKLSYNDNASSSMNTKDPLSSSSGSHHGSG